ncbi:queuosine precursor transporter [Rhodoplanes sp. SY1]|uniref:queuosine precursor transporter n=1 Tax=Rhodoplanes sp. SY1 TaxID=3166646 RepID=UPI0038B64441
MQSRSQLFLLAFAMIYCSSIVASTVVANKLILMPFQLSATSAIICFSISFILIDTAAEMYGSKVARSIVYIGLVSMIFSVAIFYLTIWLPPDQSWMHQSAFETTLGSTARICIAGLFAYFVSQRLDVVFYLALRRRIGGRYSVAGSAWVGMVVSQFIDTMIFIVAAFYGVIENSKLLNLFAGQYFAKLAAATMLAPVIALTIRTGRHWIAGGFNLK